MSVTVKIPDEYFAMDIIEQVGHHETRFWDMYMDMGANSPVVKLYEVNKTSPEGADIVDLLHSKHAYSKKICKITSIWRLQNPYLMASYLLTKAQLEKEYGVERVTSQLLLHGTKANKVDAIVQENFDLKSIKRHKYGHGIYFTNDFIFASKFCDRWTPKKTLIVANVLTSYTCPGNKQMKVPPRGYDTTKNITKNKQEVVAKYHDDTFYPAYKINFNCYLQH